MIAATQSAFDFAGRTRAESHADHLDRVSDCIASHVRDFVISRGVGGRFHMSELTEYVSRRYSGAPDSAGRVLRDLRRRGVVSVDLVSRRESLYCVRGWV